MIASAHTDSVRVVAVDASAAFRAILKHCVQCIPGLKFAGAAGNGSKALRLVDAVHPELVLLDLHLPGINGLQTLSLIREFHPSVRQFILSSDDSDEVRGICLSRGAEAFIAKRHLLRELREAVGTTFFEAGEFPGEARHGVENTCCRLWPTNH